jgi:hypothetical protein
MTNICGSCLSDLQGLNTKPPKYSLANDLWIGPIPLELHDLTIPEQLLISHLYPRCYVFKLFPKATDYVDPNTLQCGMRGTVSTYALDLQGASSMICGNLFPRRPAILSSVISVTFIGRGRLPKDWLRSTFRVRHYVVHNALRWLQVHNPKYYAEIVVSADNLSELSEDDVPIEVMGLIRQSTDIGMID